jgi:hypothetical protein
MQQQQAELFLPNVILSGGGARIRLLNSTPLYNTQRPVQKTFGEKSVCICICLSMPQANSMNRFLALLCKESTSILTRSLPPPVSLVRLLPFLTLKGYKVCSLARSLSASKR